MKYILVSTSPRRIELMKLMGVNFEVVKPKVDEGKIGIADEDPERFVKIMAERKCESVLKDCGFDLSDIVLISADTIVYLENRIIGKPRNRDDAIRTLKYLSGKWHSVFTGVCVIHRNERVEFVERTDVFFREIDDETIVEYVDSGEPLDKAGAYGIQGKASLFVRRIIGDFYNVMGFPVGRVWEELRRKGWIE